MINLCAHKLRLSQKLIPVNSKKYLSRHYTFNTGIINDCILSIRRVYLVKFAARLSVRPTKNEQNAFLEEKKIGDCRESSRYFAGKCKYLVV